MGGGEVGVIFFCSPWLPFGYSFRSLSFDVILSSIFSSTHYIISAALIQQ